MKKAKSQSLFWKFFLTMGIPMITVSEIIGFVSYYSKSHIVIIFSAIVSIVLFLLLVRWNTRIVTRNLDEMNHFALNIIAGNYNSEIRNIEIQEISQLSADLRKMGTVIQDKIVFLDTIVNSLPFPLQIMEVVDGSRPGKIIMYNSALRDYFGADDLKIQGAVSCEKLWNTEICGNERCFSQRALKSDSIIHEPFTCPGSNGNLLSFNVWSVPIKDNRGKVVNVMEILADITQERQVVQKVTQLGMELANMAMEFSNSTAQINASIQEVTDGAQTVSQGSQQQHSAVEKISLAILKIQNLSKNILGSSYKLAELSEKGKTSAKTGQSKTNSLINDIQAIGIQAQAVNSLMIDLAQRGIEINKIVDVITGIATETNLLALNAAIEAARAGDAGKGFAVVAEQVRKLAEDSKSAGEQITEILGIIQGKIDEAVKSSQMTTETIAKGEESIKETQSMLSDMYNIIDETDQGVDSELAAIKEEDESISNIVQNIEYISSVIDENAGTTQELSSSTEEIAATLEEMAASSDILSELAQGLMREINKI